MDTWLRIVIDNPALRDSLLCELDKRIMSCYTSHDRATGEASHERLIGQRESLRDLRSYISNATQAVLRGEGKDEMALEQTPRRRRRKNDRPQSEPDNTG